jgi:hypothetical protein
MREEIAQKPIANLSWSLTVDCPNCDCENDLSDPYHDAEHHISTHIFSGDWDKLNGLPVACESCLHEFTIDKVEY